MLGLGLILVWIDERGTKDMDPARPQAGLRPLTQKMGEIFVSSNIFLFFSFVLDFASADIELTAAARGFRAAASAQGKWGFSEDCENLTQMNLALI